MIPRAYTLPLMTVVVRVGVSSPEGGGVSFVLLPPPPPPQPARDNTQIRLKSVNKDCRCPFFFFIMNIPRLTSAGTRAGLRLTWHGAGS